MILTAKDMHNSPAQAYREADKGETVIINHDRYPDKVFELTARERKPLFEGITSSPEVSKLQKERNAMLPSDIDQIDANNRMKVLDRLPENKWTRISAEEKK